MTLIVCIDDKKGMMFGNKRQSRDGVLTEQIIALTEGKRLVLSSYSAPQKQSLKFGAQFED